jgi:hypothetical protein
MIIKLPKQEIDRIMEVSNSFEDALIGLFESIVPEWGKVDKLNQFVQTTRNTYSYIQTQMMDRAGEWGVTRSNVGFGWMNHGFGTINPPEKDLTVYLDESKIIYCEKE